jgi:hypothetical protein
MTRIDVERIVAEAREKGERPNLRGLDLRGLDLSELDLRWVDLCNANLRNASLRGADLRWADMCGTNLCRADLSGANLRLVDLTGSNLRLASLCGSDLILADLRWANLRGTNLRGADLYKTKGGPVTLPITPSGDGFLAPTPEGWRVTIGCWQHRTLDDLRVLVTDPDAEWPEATGKERERRRPLLATVLAFCEAHIAYHADVVFELAAWWEGSMTNTLEV